ncbi:MAG: nitroreductase family protein [Nanoarchaeota archaeon]
MFCSDTSRTANAYGKKAKIFCRQQAGAGIQNFLLEIQEKGLSTCWIGYFVEKQIKNILQVPEDINIEAIFPIGYEMGNAKPKPKIELDNTLYFNSYRNKRMKPMKKLEV